MMLTEEDKNLLSLLKNHYSVRCDGAYAVTTTSIFELFKEATPGLFELIDDYIVVPSEDALVLMRWIV